MYKGRRSHVIGQGKAIAWSVRSSYISQSSMCVCVCSCVYVCVCVRTTVAGKMSNLLDNEACVFSQWGELGLPQEPWQLCLHQTKRPAAGNKAGPGLSACLWAPLQAAVTSTQSFLGMPQQQQGLAVERSLLHCCLNGPSASS